ncbi:hypothetical protein AZF37_04305 [endosymbiont 'TC1' of Trimyema compressum]|uniref:DNA-directed RNA polymerase subunit omega n=1 Tax=endosymbiont 'TC1' of Trimyema compressum TaxID=243899 RepID=UPI0007F084E3|nr:DNA-directed RNA polymerase subunit omega [endosymbiont 'TC1' of Trimyema compressum]AMP20491.1 hypothetical protein AZF37_04305 [endosymbiont 'TC1' of Trimyema compressum]
MEDKRINIGQILKKVQSKYMLAMIAAKRGRQLASMEEKEKRIEEEQDKNKSLEPVEFAGHLSDKEREALKNHKPIIVALNELAEGELEFSFNEEK